MNCALSDPLHPPPQPLVTTIPLSISTYLPLVCQRTGEETPISCFLLSFLFLKEELSRREKKEKGKTDKSPLSPKHQDPIPSPYVSISAHAVPAWGWGRTVTAVRHYGGGGEPLGAESCPAHNPHPRTDLNWGNYRCVDLVQIFSTARRSKSLWNRHRNSKRQNKQINRPKKEKKAKTHRSPGLAQSKPL